MVLDPTTNAKCFKNCSEKVAFLATSMIGIISSIGIRRLFEAIIKQYGNQCNQNAGH